MSTTKTSASKNGRGLPPLQVIRNGRKAGHFPPKRGMRLRNDYEVVNIKGGELVISRPDKGVHTITPESSEWAITFREAKRYGFKAGHGPRLVKKARKPAARKHVAAKPAAAVHKEKEAATTVPAKPAEPSKAA